MRRQSDPPRGTSLALTLLLAAGCGAGARRNAVTFHDPNMDFSLVRTVAVMPLANLTPNPHAAERVRDTLATMLQATGSLYVVPAGEVARGISRSSLADAQAPTPEEAVQFAKLVQADALIVGTVREYGEVRSGSAAANVVALSVSMMEAASGRVVWSASSSEGGVGAGTRLFGGGGQPMNVVTERAIEDLLDKLFR